MQTSFEKLPNFWETFKIEFWSRNQENSIFLVPNLAQKYSYLEKTIMVIYVIGYFSTSIQNSDLAYK